MTQFKLTHGTDKFVVLITVSEDRSHVWSARDREQANKWADFWNEKGCEARIITMNDYLAGNFN